MQVRLEFEGSGWMRVSLTHGGQAAELLASYLDDTPRELLEALVRLVRTGGEDRILFNEEPGERPLRLRVLSGGLLRIEVHPPGEDGPPPEPLGEPLFRHTEPAERFAARVAAEFARVLREGGEAAYRDRWGYPFPRHAYDELTALLRQRDEPIG
jgi:hypothetical protein